LPDVLSASEHAWVGLDISRAMLDIAVEREVEGDVLLNDIGQGFGFRAGMFDGCIRCRLVS
jgi:18S rRNA (guanine1575-N7)-methyltransferase